MSKPTRPNDPDYGRFAAGLFASTVVLTTGSGLCLMIAAMSAPELWRPVALIAAGILGFVLLVVLMFESPIRRARNTNVYAARKQSLGDYVATFHPKLRRKERHGFGTNLPPTVDDLRQIKEDTNAWSPSERRADEYRRSLKENQRS